MSPSDLYGSPEPPGALGQAEARATAARLAGMLPAELRSVFDVSFIRSNVLYGEFVCRLVLEILRQSGLDAVLREPGSVSEVATRAGLSPDQALAPLDWMLRFLTARGLVEELPGEAAPRYACPRAWPTLDPAPVREEQLRYAPEWTPAYALAETVARDYPAFLRGDVAGEDVLFSPRRLRLWIEYFSNDNGLYVVNNRVGAMAAERWFPAAGGAVLELGGGLGSGATALLERLESTGRRDLVTGYRFTELVGAFLRRGEQTLRARYPEWPGLAFGSLDINRPFAEQDMAPASVSVVYAVNTLHVADDLAFTLGEVRRALVPGGRLVLSECVRPRQPIYAEFVFNLMKTFRAPRLHPRYRPHGGFLKPEHWQAAHRGGGVRGRPLPAGHRAHP